jgi:hypothetical protein
MAHVTSDSEVVITYMEYADINFIYGFLHYIKGIPVLIFQSKGHPTDVCAAQLEVFAVLLGNVYQQWTILCSWTHFLAGWWPFHTNLLLF